MAILLQRAAPPKPVLEGKAHERYTPARMSKPRFLPYPLVLASRSPRRRELLQLLGVEFTITVPEVDERRAPGETPTGYVQRLSREKAQAAAAQAPAPALILAADTIVVDGDSVLEKPLDSDEAVLMLRTLRGRVHHVYTAISLLETARGRLITETADSPVRMRQYSEREIAAYIASGDPFDKAGAYGIQNPEFRPAEAFDHCFANVMGLPLCHITRMLHQLGYDPEPDIPSRCQTHLAYDCPVHEIILRGGE